MRLRPDDPAAGATYYLGSAKSNTQIRLYQKGLELMGQGIPASPDLTRLELQWRPAKAGKDLAAKLAPRECWGLLGGLWQFMRLVLLMV